MSLTLKLRNIFILRMREQQKTIKNIIVLIEPLMINSAFTE